MKRIWFLVLAASVGLNAAMLWQHFTQRHSPERAPWSERAPGSGPMRGPRGSGPGRPDTLPGRGLRGGEAPSYAVMQERRLEQMSRMLGLGDEQVQRLRAIALAHAADMDSLRNAARNERGDIRDLLGSAEVDAPAVRRAAERLRDIDARIEARITENMIQEAAVLDPEQRARYLELMRFGGPRGHRGR